MTPTCIVAAREHVLTRSLKRALDPELEVVGMVDNVVSLDASMESLQPSLMIVDLHMLGADAHRILRVLLDRESCPPLIGLSSDDEPVVAAEDLGTRRHRDTVAGGARSPPGGPGGAVTRQAPTPT